MLAKKDLKQLNEKNWLTLTNVRLANTEIGIKHSVIVMATVPSGWCILPSSTILT